MTSGKRRRAEIKAARKKKAERRPLTATGGIAPCNPALLAPTNSYSLPPFAEHGFYRDLPFRCRDCGRLEVWTATQQKWWYEIAKGDVWTTARRCRGCRRTERERRNEARRVHLEGVARKHGTKRL